MVYLLLSFTPQGALLPDFVDECLENDYLENYLDGDLMWLKVPATVAEEDKQE